MALMCYPVIQNEGYAETLEAVFDLFMAIGIVSSYKLDELIYHSRGVWCIFSIQILWKWL